MTPEEEAMIAWLKNAKESDILRAMRDTEREIFREGERTDG